jgi:hypothetical protein
MMGGVSHKLGEFAEHCLPGGNRLCKTREKSLYLHGSRMAHIDLSDRTGQITGSLPKPIIERASL